MFDGMTVEELVAMRDFHLEDIESQAVIAKGTPRMIRVAGHVERIQARAARALEIDAELARRYIEERGRRLEESQL